MNKFSEVEVLKRILRCGGVRAKRIIEGSQKMAAHEEELLREFNATASKGYRITIKR